MDFFEHVEIRNWEVLFIFYYCFTKLPWTSSLKYKLTISGCQKPQLNLISLKFICQQGCFFLKILGDNPFFFLPLPASRSYLHFLTYGLFLCLQRQKHTVFMSPSLTLLPLSLFSLIQILLPYSYKHICYCTGPTV